MQHCFWIAPVSALLLVSCVYDGYYEQTPADEIRWANERIERHRVQQLTLVRLAPIERRVQRVLNEDPRVEKARFALPSDSGFECLISEGFQTSFALVLTVRAQVDEDQVSQIIESTLDQAGVRATMPLDLVNHKNMWSVRYGTLWIGPDEVVDVSSLQ